MNINPDFRIQLEEVRREGQRRISHWLPAGPHRLSIQASGEHRSEPQDIRPVEDYDRWEVAVFAADGAWVTPRTHPEIFADPTWIQYWVPSETGDTASGQSMPTEVVQTFYDFLVLGPDPYAEATRAEP